MMPDAGELLKLAEEIERACKAPNYEAHLGTTEGKMVVAILRQAASQGSAGGERSEVQSEQVPGWNATQRELEIRQLRIDNARLRDEAFLRSRNSAQEAKHCGALAEFFKWAMREGAWEGCDLDGGGIQDKAESLGLIVKTKFDPAKHNNSHGDYVEGDDYYEFAPGLVVPSAHRNTATERTSNDR